jgi:hypothetical protein
VGIAALAAFLLKPPAADASVVTAAVASGAAIDQD